MRISSDATMKFRYSRCLATILLINALMGTVGAAFGKQHTRIGILSRAQSIEPGRKFMVGVTMTMDKGWHTYWKNPGEAGLATTIQWTLPDGIRSGPIQWPVPHKYLEGGGEVLTFGYEGTNMLLVEIQPPADLKPGTTVTLTARVDWLECEHICIPGTATVSITLPVKRERPKPANEEMFAGFLRRLPAEQDDDLKVTHELGDREVRISIATKREMEVRPDAVPDFYPEALEGIDIGRTVVNASGTGATMTLPLEAHEKQAGPATMSGLVVYQFPGEERMARTVKIELTPEFMASLTSNGDAGFLERPFENVAGAGDEQSLTLIMIFAVLGGLLLNIMPCVLPVIALKVFGLVSLAGDQPERVRKLGWVFSLGILVSFLVLAVLVIILKAGGEQVGWGFQFQEPGFVIAMSAIVFAFGLSLFGVFEIQLPGMAVTGVSNLLGKQGASGKSLSGSFAEGVFATILATPCTAPFLGTALGFAFSQPAHIILAIFTCVAAGMALPYVVLTSRPAWVRFLPRPGEWMVTAKQFMGFFMMATLLWLLYVLGKQLGMEAVVWTGAFLLFLGMACWAIGRYATLTALLRTRIITWSAAAAVIIAGYFLFLSPVLEARGVLENGQADASADEDGIQWEEFSPRGVEAHIGDNRTVFIDFTADWCLTCKVNEKIVLSDPDVVDAFKSGNIAAMKADWTNRNPDITRLMAKFGRSGVPLYVVFPAGSPQSPLVLPEVITEGIVIEALRKASVAERKKM